MLFRSIAAAARALLAANTDCFDDQPPLLRMVSPLAEGADRLAARAALEHGYGLICPLPFAREEYAKDFGHGAARAEFDQLLAQAEAVFEIDGRRDDEGKAYEAVGLMVLRQCDLLIALWNGGGSGGRGGTAEIVETAIHDGIPVIWIDPANPAPRIPYRDPLSGGASQLSLDLALEVDAAGIAEVIDRLAAPPRPAPAGETGPRERLHRYLAEPEASGRVFRAYRWMVFALGAGRLNNVDRRPYVARALGAWQPFEAAMGSFRDRAPGALFTSVRDAFAWADGLASLYGDWRRAASVLTFTLGALAVLLALAALPIKFLHENKPILVGVELMVLVYAIRNAARGQRSGWHDRWVDYRALAERLRVVRVLALVGSPNTHLVASEADSGERSGAWIDWYDRAIGREVTLPNVAVGPDYLRTAVSAFNSCELDDQIAYHQRNAKRMHLIDHRLERVAEGALFATIAVGAAYIVWAFARGWPHNESPDPIANWVTFFAGLLPAVGAACFGIREQGGFDRLGVLSHRTAEQLSLLKAHFAVEDPTTSLAAAARLIEGCAGAMTAESGDWNSVFRAKPLALP